MSSKERIIPNPLMNCFYFNSDLLAVHDNDERFDVNIDYQGYILIRNVLALKLLEGNLEGYVLFLLLLIMNRSFPG